MMHHKTPLKKGLLNLFLPAALLGATMLGSCSDSDDIASPDGPYKQVGRYAFSLRDSQDSISAVFDGITAGIVRVESPFTWLDIEDNGKDDLGNTRVSIVRTGDTPEDFESDSAQVVLYGGDAVRLVISAQGDIRPSGDNSGEYDAFNTAWWEQQTIGYRTPEYINGKLEVTTTPIPLPWAQAASSQIPPSLFEYDGVTPERGWTMAYNLFESSAGDVYKSYPYFMLYNKYTGVLRVFYYQREDVGTGGEVSFIVTPDMPKTPKYPYYNSLQYGIPVCNGGILEKGNVLGIVNSPQGKCAFQQQITPYLKSSVTLQKGWYCFDLDWSAYNPTQTSPFRANDRFSIDIHTSSNASMTLNGAITATASGKIEGLGNTSTSSSSGTTLLEDVWGERSDIAAGIAAIFQGKYLTALKKGWSVLYSLGKSIYKRETTNPYEEEEVEDNTGTINLNFTGQINLSGYINSNTSNNAENVEFSYNSFQQYDSLGVGIWSLQDNPVVYVVNDVILGEYNAFTCLATASDYSMGSEDPVANNLRLFTFFDPTSLKFNLNTNAFKDVHNVKMTWTYGVYPNQTHGHTNVYRKSLLGLTVAEPILIDKTSANRKKLYNSSKSKFANMSYIQLPVANQTMTKLSTSDRPSFYAQSGSQFRYYGCAGNEQSASSKDFFVVDPAVCLPTGCVDINEKTGYGTGKLYDFQAPDFVVGVILTFDYTREDGKKAQGCFSKRFVPEVKSIDRATMLKKRDELQTYVNNGLHQTLSNGLEVQHVDAATLLNGFFSTSSYISNH